MTVLSLRFCARAFSSCSKWGPLFIAVHGPLTIAASLVAEHRLQARRLSNCGLRAQLLRGMWDLPRPGLEPVSPALAGRFSTTAPPGKPNSIFLIKLQQIILAEHFSILEWACLPMKEQSVLKWHRSLEGFIMAEFECYGGHLRGFTTRYVCIFLIWVWVREKRTEELEVQDGRLNGPCVELEFGRK